MKKFKLNYQKPFFSSAKIRQPKIWRIYDHFYGYFVPSVERNGHKMADTKRTERIAIALLFMVAIIWGGGFVVTKASIDAGFPPSFVLAVRFSLGAAFMFIAFFKKLKDFSKSDVIVGAIAGVMLCVAFLLQTIGAKYTSPSNSALITSLNVVMVPFLGWMIAKNRPPLKTVLLSISCFFGMMQLSHGGAGTLSFNIGDVLTLFCALAYALHISYLGVSAPRIRNVFMINAVQLFVSAILSTIYFFLFEYTTITYEQIKTGGLGLLFLGVFSTGLCFLLQSYGQKILPPVKVAIIICLEGMFGTIISILFGYDPLSISLIIGMIIIIGSLILLEVESIPLLNKKKSM